MCICWQTHRNIINAYVHNTRDFGKTSLTELTEAGVLEGPEQKMFLLNSSASSPDPGLTKMEMLLNAKNQIDIVRVFLDNKLRAILYLNLWNLSYGGSVTHKHDLKNRKGLDIIMDILVDLCR